jgi:putative salt-induced outer membrane protein YdiY
VLRHIELPLLGCVLAFSAVVHADQITLKNGDRLTGTVVKSDGKTLVLHTDAAADVTLKMDAIQEIKSDAELNVTTKDGKTAVGPVTTRDGKLEIATKGGGTVEAPTGDVTLIRNDAEQSAYEKSLHPGLMHGWSGGTNVGFSVARGNSQTENLALAFNAIHPTVNSKITLYESSIYTRNDLASPTIVANLTTAGFRYDHDIVAKLFAFGAADFMSNALQYLDLRQVYTGGLGFHAIKNASTILDFLGGVNYTHETYSNGALIPGTGAFVSYGVTNRLVALTLGEELNQKLGKSTVLMQNVDFYPDIQKYRGQYRFTFNLGTVTKINTWLGWQNQFGDIYVTNPPIGAKKNDVLLTTGLNISFGAKPNP